MSENFATLLCCITVFLVIVTSVIFVNNKRYDVFEKVTGNERNLTKWEFFWYSETFNIVELNKQKQN
jgi:hypothetical protein